MTQFIVTPPEISTTRLPTLLLSTPLCHPPFPSGEKRPEPYGFQLKEACFFRPEKEPYLWSQFVGWHDWAVLLNGDLGGLFSLAQACREGRHPVTGLGNLNGRPFPEALLEALPQFLLSVWELELNGWKLIDFNNPISNVLLKAGQGRAVLGRRSAIEAVFEKACNLAPVIELTQGLGESLGALRARHANHQATNPWCWLRFYCEKCQMWGILHLLKNELEQWAGNKIITPEKINCQRWIQAVQERWVELETANPGFDWLVTYPGPVDLSHLVNYLTQIQKDFDETRISIELANDLFYMQQWIDGLELNGKGSEENWSGPPKKRGSLLNSQGNKKVIRDPKMEARDKWLYLRCKSRKKTYKAIRLELNRIASMKGWEDIYSEQGIKQAVDRYIEREGLDPLPPRKEG